MKIAFITAMWQRPKVFDLFGLQMQNIREVYGADNIQCFVAGSEGEVSKSHAECFGFEYIETLNKPISRKLDTACHLAREWNPDYCMMLGSDDLVGKSMMDEYLGEASRSGTDYIYTLDCYFYDIISRRGLYWGGYQNKDNIGHACGAGRMLSRRLMDAMDWSPWMPAYTDGRLDGLLDTAMDHQMAKVEHTRCAVNLKNCGAYMVDIKSSTNMTPFDRWDNTDFIDPDQMIRAAFPEHISNAILTASE